MSASFIPYFEHASVDIMAGPPAFDTITVPLSFLGTGCFENAVAKNRELIQANQDLALAKDQLEQNNQELRGLNQKIASANDQMTRDLEAAARVQRALLPAEETLHFNCGEGLAIRSLSWISR